jgi:hypothetical protein
LGAPTCPNALTEFTTFELNPWEIRTANGTWNGPIHGSWNISADEAWYGRPFDRQYALWLAANGES